MTGPVAPRSWTLKPAAIEGLRERVHIDAPTTLGRLPSNDVVLAESAYPHVSGHHARVARGDDGHLVVEDLGSRHGTFVNDRRVQRAALCDGDVLRLGEHGPQFVVEEVVAGTATGLVPHSLLGPVPLADPSHTGVVRMKRALGVPEGADVGALVAGSEQRGRLRLRRAAVAGIAVIVVGAVLVRLLQHGELQALSRLNQDLQQQLATTSTAFGLQQAAWEEQKRSLEQERASLQQRIGDLAVREQTSMTELVGLRRSLDDTNERLQRFDPVNLERARLEEVGRVQRAVVFIETRMRLRSTKTQKLLRLRADVGTADTTASFADEDTVFERESTGSGFCVDVDGAIVTNAHVVRPEGSASTIAIGADDVLRPELSHFVVFSGSDQRHEARLVKLLDDSEDDLALLQIEPFADMPFLPAFRTDAAAPAAGAVVYLHGFPLGMMAMQEGRRVIASCFRGILSRTVSNWLQVDAAVHPGNSGGPLTDERGTVIGVVTRVQRIAGDAIAPDMGYAIPIAAVARLLAADTEPPPK